MKLNAQLAEVESALAGARIRSGTISAGYNHVIPSQPTAKNELNRKRKSAATMPEHLVPNFVIIVRIICSHKIRACQLGRYLKFGPLRMTCRWHQTSLAVACQTFL